MEPRRISRISPTDFGLPSYLWMSSTICSSTSGYVTTSTSSGTRGEASPLRRTFPFPEADMCIPQSMLAGHYAAARPPPGLRKLVIANSPASIPLFVAGTNALLEKFPTEYVENIRKLEAEGKTSSPEYQNGVMEFYAKHVCTTNPWPQGLIDSFNAVGGNPTVYHTMYSIFHRVIYEVLIFCLGLVPQSSTSPAPSSTGRSWTFCTRSLPQRCS